MDKMEEGTVNIVLIPRSLNDRTFRIQYETRGDILRVQEETRQRFCGPISAGKYRCHQLPDNRYQVSFKVIVSKNIIVKASFYNTR